MKFLADMGISPRTVSWLRSQGYDAIHLVEQGLEKIPDEAMVLEKCQAELSNGAIISVTNEYYRVRSLPI